MTLNDLFTLLNLPIGTSGHDMTQLHYVNKEVLLYNMITKAYAIKS